jgi:hypothetical protein
VDLCFALLLSSKGNEISDFLEDAMTNRKQLLGVKLVLILTQIAALSMLSDQGTAQVTMPRMREMASMQNHHSHPQKRETAAKPFPDNSTQTFTFTSLDVPEATGTLATGINARGHIVGIYYDGAGNSHGFLLKKGAFFTVDVPGSLVGVSGTLQTEANGINHAGDIVGDYYARLERLAHPPAPRTLNPSHRSAGVAFCTARVNFRMCWFPARKARFRTPSCPTERFSVAITTATTLLRWSDSPASALTRTSLWMPAAAN